MKLSNKISNKIFLSVIVFALLFSSSLVGAQTADILKNKIDDRNKEIEKLEAEIAAYKKDLANLDKEANTLQSSIKKLDLTKQKLLRDIQVTESKIDATGLQIEELSLDIGSKEEKIGNGRSAIAEGLREMNELDLQSLTEIFLSKKRLSEIWNDIESIRGVQSTLGARINELRTVKAELQSDKDEAEAAKEKLVYLKSELGDQKKINDQNTAEKGKLLKQTKNQEANYKKILADKLALKASFEKELKDYESQLKFILDPSTLPKSGSGVLSWPLSDIYITQLFGATVDAKRLYVSGSHNGIDFRASVGTPIKAMAGGTVLGTGDTDLTCSGASYGRWVLIRHNNGLSSIYAHLSLIKVSQGENIAVGQVIGYSGATGYATGPHLHIGIYAANAVKISTLPSKACGGRTYTMPVAPLNTYLDPMLYLPSYNR